MKWERGWDFADVIKVPNQLVRVTQRGDDPGWAWHYQVSPFEASSDIS